MDIYIYMEQHGKKLGKKVLALLIWIDTDSQWIAKHGISGFDQHHEDF